MLKKLEYVCAVGSIALIGADRIDLLWGHGFFKLTPFLFFATLLVFIHIFWLASRRGLKIPSSPPIRRQIPFLVIFTLFLFLTLVSTLFGLNPERGLVAFASLLLVSAFGYCISVRILRDPTPEKLVLRSVTCALIVWLTFCIGGYIAWTHGATRVQEEAASSVESMFAPSAAFFFAPRLAGYSLDANRAGFILVMYLALLDHFVVKTRYTRFLRFVIGVFLLLAVSRSAFLCWMAYYLFSKGFWRRLATRRTAFTLAAVASTCLLVALAYRNEITRFLDLWQLSDVVSDRLSGAEGTSGGDHIELIQRGLEIWSTSPGNMVAGIGFAGSPRFLSDFFGDSKYGNFHSLYVSILAELGLPAFLLLMILLGYPMLGRKGATPCIAAIAIFNIALQSYMEPFFWMALALAWSFELRHRRALPRPLVR